MCQKGPSSAVLELQHGPSALPSPAPSAPSSPPHSPAELPGLHLPTDPCTGQARAGLPKPQRPHPRHFTFTSGADRQPALCYPTPLHPAPPHSTRSGQSTAESAPHRDCPRPPTSAEATQPAALPLRPATAAPPDRSPGLPPLPSAMLGPAPRLSREPPPAPPSRAERGVLARAALHLPLRPPPALGGSSGRAGFSPRRSMAAAPPSGRERALPRPAACPSGPLRLPDTTAI